MLEYRPGRANKRASFDHSIFLIPSSFVLRNSSLLALLCLQRSYEKADRCRCHALVILPAVASGLRLLVVLVRDAVAEALLPQPVGALVPALGARLSGQP